MDEVQSRRGGARVVIPPPLVFLAGLAAGVLVDRLVLRRPVPGGVAARVGLAVLAIGGGVALGGSASRLFRRSGQDPRPWQPTPELVFAGPYRLTRNPMYVGMTLLTIGIGAAAGTLWTVPFALAALGAVHVLAVLPEERYLTAKFGAPYLEYKARVRRYL
ncbi:MAG TPA: isoprenylcysteine carboxylmethyltransferase family protein [Myxococcaceae bacterium]|nr:isoprenylcysteine carboxylmethyltransferase family protein [Myxococcaceae bacterium]